MKNIHVMSVLGTRADAIKMAPVIKELEKHPDKIRSIVTLSAQHREMLDQVLENFKIQADYDLNIMAENQKLSQVTCSVISGLEPVLEKENIDFMLVQGDTTTTFAASLIGFYHKIPIGHIEAGLRTYNMYCPFPEESNRTLTSRLTSIHFAPTQLAKENLLKEGIPDDSIIITGNTVIDALLYIIKQEKIFLSKPLKYKKQILVTTHRRENWGRNLENICFALLDILKKNSDVEIIFPVHLNPNVQKTVRKILADHERIKLLEPLDYRSFCKWVATSYLILTDSGGIQEEAPSLGKPVLVLRNETERPEAIKAGGARLVGTTREKIVSETNMLLTNFKEYRKMSSVANPFGDGKASERIVEYFLDQR